MSGGLFQRFDGAWLLDGLRTPMVDYQGAFADANPIDLGIFAARALLARAGVDAATVDAVITGNMAPGGFDQFYVARHIGLYSGVPQAVPALNVQRICGTGFELFRQAAEQIATGAATTALLVGTESMSRNPIAAFEHRGGFRLGTPPGFKDFLWEALSDPAAGVNMIQTAENLAQRHGITREAVDAFAARSFERAVAAQAAGWFDGETVPVRNAVFELDGHRPRALKLAGKAEVADRDTHPRPTPPEVLAKLRTVYPGGVQTGGNSSALTDGAAAALVVDDATMRRWQAQDGGRAPLAKDDERAPPAKDGERAPLAKDGKRAPLAKDSKRAPLTKDSKRAPLARVAAAAVVGVEPAFMGIGPAPAIRLLLARSGLTLDDIACLEVNEAQGAQTLAVAQALDLDPQRLNAHGGAIALGHPLAATGVRLTVTCARQLRDAGARWGVASACIGGGQGIALLLENPAAAAR